MDVIFFRSLGRERCVRMAKALRCWLAHQNLHLLPKSMGVRFADCLSVVFRKAPPGPRHGCSAKAGSGQSRAQHVLFVGQATDDKVKLGSAILVTRTRAFVRGKKQIAYSPTCRLCGLSFQDVQVGRRGNRSRQLKARLAKELLELLLRAFRAPELFASDCLHAHASGMCSIS